MKASELRIGNFFLLNGQVAEVGWATIMEIDRKEKGLLVTYHGLPPKHEPIPLTEEWLIKFGFTPNLISYYKDISYFPKRVYKTLCAHGIMGISIREGEIDAPRENDVLITLWNIDVHGPLYIHQLQNLYFALTGEELTVKES